MDLSKTQFLISQALEGGGREEVGALLEHLRPRLVLWCASRMGGRLQGKSEPEDAAQETLLSVSRSIGDFKGNDIRAFMAWLFQIGENRIRDMAAHHGAKKRQEGPPLTVSQTSPSSAAARREQVDRIARSIETLRPEYADVLRLRRFEERSVKEIAELMDRTENAVRILYCRALKALRAGLDVDGEIS